MSDHCQGTAILQCIDEDSIVPPMPDAVITADNSIDLDAFASHALDRDLWKTVTYSVLYTVW